MKPLATFPVEARERIRVILTDIDDTLTTDGLLTARAYTAMEDLKKSGFGVVPITGRPAGWCDHIARMWPVDGVVGENGAFYFRYDRANRKMERHFALSEETLQTNAGRLNEIKQQILSEVPGAGIASDQAYRIADLAIDFCEDVAPLDEAEISRIVSIFENAGAIAKISSIHVNGWFGEYDKLTMSHCFLKQCMSLDIDNEDDRNAILYIGDSPNDAPMFGYFPQSVGVANIKKFAGKLDAEPTYITHAHDGDGFVEMAEILLSGQSIS